MGFLLNVLTLTCAHSAGSGLSAGDLLVQGGGGGRGDVDLIESHWCCLSSTNSSRTYQGGPSVEDRAEGAGATSSIVSEISALKHFT